MTIRAGILQNEQYPDGTYVAQVGSWMEYGTRTIPARPFMAKAEAHIRSGALDRKLEQIANFNNIFSDSVQHQIGQFMRDSIKAAIVSTDYVPNAPATIAAKGHANQLIDTERLLDSIDYDFLGEV